MSEAAECSGSHPKPLGSRAYVLKSPSVTTDQPNDQQRTRKEIRMDSTQESMPAAPQEPRRNDQVLSGPQKLVATFLLALGLMAAGGAALVSAASPDPSASTAPSASSGASNGSGGSTAPSQHANCPNM
jgi:hypothetical protein